MKLENGKLDSRLLEGLLNNIECNNANVIVGPKVGADCAYVNLDAGVYAVGADPITFEVSRPGYYAIHVNANDVAVSGAIPSYYTQTIILPTGTESSVLESIMEDSLNTAKELGITLIGGHTEISDVVKRPLISVCMFGQTINKVNLAENVKPGDVIVQVNPLAMEGTAILAEMFSSKLLKNYDDEYIQKAKDLIYYPGLSVVKPAVYASKELPVKFMHDPTEGGVVTGLREMAAQTSCGLLVDEDKLIIKKETISICNECGCNPLGLISSGTLLAVFAENHVNNVLSSFTDLGYKVAVIAKFTENTGVYKSIKNEKIGELLEFKVDELYSCTNP